MTHQEVLQLKHDYGDSIVKNNLIFMVLVVPKETKDLINFLSNYEEDTYKDEDCKKYSSNNQFMLYVYMNKLSRKNKLNI